MHRVLAIPFAAYHFDMTPRPVLIPVRRSLFKKAKKVIALERPV